MFLLFFKLNSLKNPIFVGYIKITNEYERIIRANSRGIQGL